jgi:hypothetical protein
MTKKINYTEKLQKIVKKRKIPIIKHKQGRGYSVPKKTLKNLSCESYCYYDNN